MLARDDPHIAIFLQVIVGLISAGASVCYGTGSVGLKRIPRGSIFR